MSVVPAPPVIESVEPSRFFLTLAQRKQFIMTGVRISFRLAILVDRKFFAANDASALFVINFVRVNVTIPALYVAEMFVAKTT